MESDEHQKLREEGAAWPVARDGDMDRRHPITAATLIRSSATVSLSGTSGMDFIACSAWDNGVLVVSFSIHVRQCPSFSFSLPFFRIRKSEDFMHSNLRRLRDEQGIYLTFNA